jgi:hypothetical protein
VSRHVEHGVPWRYIFLHRQKHAQRGRCDGQIRIVKFVANVEAKRAELTSLLYDGVEEAEGEDQFVPVLVLALALLKEVLVEVHEGLLQVGLESSGGFEGEFAAILENGDWEIISRH